MSKIKTKLIATNFRYLSHFKDQKSEKYMLGEWCFQDIRKMHKEGYKYLIQKHHWDDSHKFTKDFNYLEDLNERLILSMSIFLNKYHKVNFSTRYWRIILGPWLLTFIPIIFDRWETLKVALDLEKLWEFDLFEFDSNNFIPNNFTSFQQQQSNHMWNNYIFSEILTSQYANKVNFNIIKYQEKYPVEDIKKNKYSFKYKVFSYFDNLMSLNRLNYKVIFVRSYFNFFSVLKLSLKLKQIPRIHSIFDKNIIFKGSISDGDRSFKLDDFHPENDFEEFIKEKLCRHVPKSYLEGYSQIAHEANKINNKGSIIFTANAHLDNDFFNHWCGKMVETGTKLIISQHGGALKQPQNMFLHQEKISDKMVVWHTPSEPNHVRLPANKLVSNKRLKTGNELSLVGLEQEIYSYRAQTGPNPSSMLNDFKQKIDFALKLSDNPYKCLKVRSSNRGEGSFNSLSRYRKTLGITKISNYDSFDKMLVHSKIIVCSYPETTYLESMFSGIPTISLFQKEDYKFSKIFDNLIRTLEKNNMIFYDSISAANHINNIWNNPSEWWESESVLAARQMFHHTCGDGSSDWIDIWSSFFNEFT